MDITPQYKRRIHIMGKPDGTTGHMLKVYDAQTSEEITNICRIELILDARETNVAKITYCEYDMDGKMLLKQGEPVHGEVISEQPSLSLTAYEIDELPPQEKE